MSKPLSRTLACLLTTTTVLSLWASALLIVALRQPVEPLLTLQTVAPAASAGR